jgi:hypothetical protein
MEMKWTAWANEWDAALGMKQRWGVSNNARPPRVIHDLTRKEAEAIAAALNSITETKRPHSNSPPSAGSKE